MGERSFCISCTAVIASAMRPSSLTHLSQLGSVIIFFLLSGREKFRDFKGRQFQSGCSVDQVSFQAGGFAYNATASCTCAATGESKTARSIATGTLSRVSAALGEKECSARCCI